MEKDQMVVVDMEVVDMGVVDMGRQVGNSIRNVRWTRPLTLHHPLEDVGTSGPASYGLGRDHLLVGWGSWGLLHNWGSVGHDQG